MGNWFGKRSTLRTKKSLNLEKKLLSQRIDKRKKLTALFFSSALTILLGTSLYLWQFTKIVQYNRTIYELEKEISSFKQGNIKLKAEIAQLSAISRIKIVADQRLHMREPSEIVYLKLD
ncbi:septum formation initiator family protein [Candidatus Riflebacteria bacterium]